MIISMKDLGTDQLNPEQRVSLALEIWESLGDAALSLDLSDDQFEELTRRDAELDAHSERALTWNEIRTSIESQS